jgi:hypothetical protein
VFYLTTKDTKDTKRQTAYFLTAEDAENAGKPSDTVIRDQQSFSSHHESQITPQGSILGDLGALCGRTHYPGYVLLCPWGVE